MHQSLVDLSFNIFECSLSLSPCPTETLTTYLFPLMRGDLNLYSSNFSQVAFSINCETCTNKLFSQLIIYDFVHENGHFIKLGHSSPLSLAVDSVQKFFLVSGSHQSSFYQYSAYWPFDSHLGFCETPRLTLGPLILRRKNLRIFCEGLCHKVLVQALKIALSFSTCLIPELTIKFLVFPVGIIPEPIVRTNTMARQIIASGVVSV